MKTIVYAMPNATIAKPRTTAARHECRSTATSAGVSTGTDFGETSAHLKSLPSINAIALNLQGLSEPLLEKTDGRLVAEVREGEIERAYREHGPRLWRALLAFTGDPEMASDAMAEAFVQALRRGEAINSPVAWVWRAAFRLAAGELKDRRFGQTSAATARGSYEIPERAEEVIRALAGLSPNQRAAIVLHHYAGYPVKEIAAMIGSTAPAIRVHLSVGRKRLRSLLGGFDD